MIGHGDVRMSDSVKEQLSACLDGELAEAEMELLVKRLGRDAEYRATLGRYSLISECMRGERPAAASPAFATKVMAALDKEPVAQVSGIRSSSALARRLKPAAGFAIAAGVAAVAVLSVQQRGVDPVQLAETETSGATAETIVGPAPEPSYTVPTNTPTGAFVPAARLTNYVVAHSEYSSPLGRRTVLSGMLSEDDVIPAGEPDEPAPVEEAQVTIP